MTKRRFISRARLTSARRSMSPRSIARRSSAIRRAALRLEPRPPSPPPLALTIAPNSFVMPGLVPGITLFARLRCQTATSFPSPVGKGGERSEPGEGVRTYFGQEPLTPTLSHHKSGLPDLCTHWCRSRVNPRSVGRGRRSKQPSVSGPCLATRVRRHSFSFRRGPGGVVPRKKPEGAERRQTHRQKYPHRCRKACEAFRRGRRA